MLIAKTKLAVVTFVVSILAGIIILAAAGEAADTTAGLIGHWKLDEESGTIAKDSSGKGRDQTTKDSDGDGKEVVLLNGLKSYDGDGGLIANWIWTENGTEIAKGFAPRAEFATGTHEVTLNVTDETGLASTDTVTIKVLSQP